MNPLSITAGIIIALSVSNAFFFYKWSAVDEQYIQFQANVEAANREAALENQRRDDAARSNTAEVARIYSSYAADLGRTHRSRLDGVRQQLGDCEAAFSVATASIGADATPSNTGLAPTAPNPAGLVSVCERLEADCAATTLQLVWLQDWTKRVCK